MRGALQRALRMTFSPAEEWPAVARESPSAPMLFVSFVFPLACIPAACWALNRILFGDERRPGAVPVSDLAQSAHGGLSVFACAVASIALLAAAVFALAPLFGRPRDWPKAVQVSACSSAPVFLAGFLLLLPDLSYLLLPPAFQSAYLLYGGLQHVMGVREDQAAEYVALDIVLLIVGSTMLGGLGSGLGVL